MASPLLPISLADACAFFKHRGATNLKPRTVKRLRWQIPIFLAITALCYVYTITKRIGSGASTITESQSPVSESQTESHELEESQQQSPWEESEPIWRRTGCIEQCPDIKGDPDLPGNCAGTCQSKEEFLLEEAIAKDFNIINAKNMLKYEDACLTEAMSNDTMGRYKSSTKLAVIKDEKMIWIAWYIFGVVYCFIGLAIVCDEFFVPALECFVDEFGISMDVAGATFMAAGGSMPELATSFIGTFRESELGFVTIVGSAVFNVLFVIAVCAIASPEVLPLTWWPLARDCTFYIIALFTVAFVFKVHSENTIDWWEALLLLFEYIAYCTFMKFNSKVYTWIEEKFLKKKPKKDQVTDESAEDGKDGKEKDDKEGKNANPNFNKPSTFRTGIVQILTKNKYMYETAGIAAVTRIHGDLEETFAELDTDKDGMLGVDEIKPLLAMLGAKTDTNSVKTAMRRINRTGEEQVSFESFKRWYVTSEARVQAEVYHVFEEFDKDKSGDIDALEIEQVLKSLNHKPGANEIQAIIEDLRQFCKDYKGSDGSTDMITSDGPSMKDADSTPHTAPSTKVDEATVDHMSPVEPYDAETSKDFRINLEQFQEWYSHSLFYQKKQEMQAAESEAEDGYMTLEMPENPCWSALFWYIFTYPAVAFLYCTLPDVRHPKLRRNYRVAILEFTLCLAWIGIINLWLVECLIVVSQTLQIPVAVSAVTLLAGGTSVPDLLSSYVVAKNKEGDMAVSSSIGSNIFDVTVGLPLPWLAYCIAKNKSFNLGKDGSQGLVFNIILLITMLGAVIGTIIVMKWRMTKAMGYMMFLFYILYIIQYLVQKMPDRCPPEKDGLFQIELGD